MRRTTASTMTAWARGARTRGARLVGTACERLAGHGDPELERALALSRAIIDSTPGGILVRDRSGEIIAHNEALRVMWKVPPDFEATPEHLRQTIVATLRDPASFFQELEQRRPDEVVSDHVELADGRVFERVSVPFRRGAEIVGRVSHFRDVTERLRAVAERERLLAWEQRARASAVEAEGRASFLAEASRLLVSLDHESALAGVARLAVPRLADRCTVGLTDARGALRRVATAIDDPTASVRDGAGEPMPEGEIVMRSGRASLDAGGERAAGNEDLRAIGAKSYLAVPLSAGGSLLGALVLVSLRAERRFGPADLALAEDVAGRMALAVENARLNDGLCAALRAREEFLQVASHELLTPLTSLQLGVQRLLRAGRDAPSSDDRVLRSLERLTARMARLVDGMIHVARRGPAAVELTDLDLVEVSRDVVYRLSPDAENAGCSLTLLAPEPVRGRWDRAGVERVLENILSNAIRFGKGAPIEVRVSARNARAWIEVSDQGIGIAPEVLDRIFRRFERGVPMCHYGGLGLGLYVAREIVERLGGTIGARSTPGHGATFLVELPIEGARREGDAGASIAKP